MTLRAVQSLRQEAPEALQSHDPLDAFAPESALPAVKAVAAAPGSLASDPDESGPDLRPPASARSRPQGTSLRTAFLIIGAVLSLVAGGIVAFQLQAGSASLLSVAPRTGRLALETRPPGALVEIDGQPRGTTPVTVDLAAGAHTVTLRHEADERTVSVTMTAGGQVSQYFELAAPSLAAPVGHLTIVTEPPGARVMINGEARGVTPVTVRDLEATRHKVTVASATGSSERIVDVEPGATTSVVFALARPGVTAGYLSVQSAFNVQILERGDILGSSAASRVMMAAGRHEITLSNAELGFEERRAVEIRPGATASIRVEATAALNINARPWADVTVNGVALGQTPIANHSLPLGSHLVVFRHPQFGERRENVVVTARGPNRISVDLTR